jgi:GT2 family glycosyltransferase
LAGDTVRALLLQDRKPNLVIVCPAHSGDWDDCIEANYPIDLIVLPGQRGLTTQRNAILAVSEGFDYLVFFDDDFVPAASYLQNMEAILDRHPEIIAATGHVIKDGILGPGLSKFDAEQSIQKDAGQEYESELIPVYNVYGCNMGFRLSAVLEQGVKFDESLPLYGWLEDVDFSRQIACFGTIAKTNLCRGVHLGSKRGRTPGVKLGYSQVANPLYLMGKGTMEPARALSQMMRNVIANIWKFWRPEPWVDRKGRLHGNFLAFLDLLGRKISPMSITKL